LRAENEILARNQIEIAVFRRKSVSLQVIDDLSLLGQVHEHPAFKVFYMGKHMYEAIESILTFLQEF
jgi:hypothetical protein